MTYMVSEPLSRAKSSGVMSMVPDTLAPSAGGVVGCPSSKLRPATRLPSIGRCASTKDLPDACPPSSGKGRRF